MAWTPQWFRAVRWQLDRYSTSRRKDRLRRLHDVRHRHFAALLACSRLRPEDYKNPLESLQSTFIKQLEEFYGKGFADKQKGDGAREAQSGWERVFGKLNDPATIAKVNAIAAALMARRTETQRSSKPQQAREQARLGVFNRYTADLLGKGIRHERTARN